jgi:hypothetical protein
MHTQQAVGIVVLDIPVGHHLPPSHALQIRAFPGNRDLDRSAARSSGSPHTVTAYPRYPQLPTGTYSYVSLLDLT